MRSYGQYCPVAIAAEVLGDRWTLLIVRELLHGVSRFGRIEHGLPGISRSILTERLRRMTSAGVVERRVEGGEVHYRLTPAGRALEPAIHGLGDWAATWVVGEPTVEQLDPSLLMWWIARHIRGDRVERPLVVEFDFGGARAGRFWLVMRPGDVSVCIDHPGLDVDLVAAADVAALYRVYAGRLELDDAIRDGSVRLEGPPSAARRFRACFGVSGFAPAARRRMAARAGA